SLARVSRDDQINSLDVTKAAKLLEKRGVVWIAPTFAHVSNGDRGMNESDAVRLRSLLRARREWPSSGDAAKRDELASPHWRPRGWRTSPSYRLKPGDWKRQLMSALGQKRTFR